MAKKKKALMDAVEFFETVEDKYGEIIKHSDKYLVLWDEDGENGDLDSCKEFIFEGE